ncbi:copper resistance protein B [Lysobacter sp. CA199]|uniref:copper resistance protein B n=1 Tax=Lysobacter sp. CA199 TaxID=3455608 RepID=UPI003F8D2B4E
MKTLSNLPRSTLALGLLLSGAAQAQSHDHRAHEAAAQTSQSAAAVDHSKMDHSDMSDSGPATQADANMDHSGMDHSKMDHSNMGPSAPPATVDHSKMVHPPEAQSQAPTAPREPIPAPTQADRAAAFPPLSHHMQHASELNHYVLFNRLEAVEAEHGGAQAWEGQAWIGNDTDRLWLRSEGERERGRTESADLEALYGRAISPWWDLVVGAKHDFRPRRSQTWAAIGVQGMSPYKFEVAATAYVGPSGRSALNFEAEYELLLTNRLILQPLIEVEVSGKQDPRRGVGSGLSTLEAGLRLRYEITRRFAPYLGISRERAFGGTADYRRDEGEGIDDTRWVAGVRVWF